MSLVPTPPITTRYCLQCGSVIAPDTHSIFCPECIREIALDAVIDRSDEEPDWSAA